MDKDKLERLLKTKQRGTLIREFLGVADIQRVTLRNVFPGSNIVAVSPVESHAPWPTIVLQGPEFQINFLHNCLLKLVAATISEKNGKWNGICKRNAERIDLSYEQGEWPWNRVHLAEYIFRRDAAKFANLKLTELSTLRIIYDGKKVLDDITVSLPDDVENGDVELPQVAFLQ